VSRLSGVQHLLLTLARRLPAVARRFLVHSPALFIVIALDDGRCLEISHALAKRLGYARGEIVGRALRGLQLAAGRRAWARFCAAQAGEGGNPQRLTIQSRSGRRLSLCVAGRVVGTGPARLLIALGRDITAEREVRRLRHALRASEAQRIELEHLAAAGQMSAQLAHEINNPLAGIQNALLLIRRAMPPDHPRFRYLELVDHEIQRIVQIVRQSYDLYRREPGPPSAFALRDCVDELLLLCQPAIRTRGLKIEVLIEPAQATVCLSEGHVRQILYNLLTNAIKASPPEASIKITLVLTESIVGVDPATAASTKGGPQPKTRSSLSTPPLGVVPPSTSDLACDKNRAEPRKDVGTALEMSVADQGPGIPDDIRDRIFEPFFGTRGPGPDGGLGLGLVICKRLSEALGGSIEVRSALGKGSVFHVILPLADRETGRPRP